jgi:hypothetical protein
MLHMETGHTIRDSIAKVTALRARSSASPPLETAIREVKWYQAQRFSKTYADILANGPHQEAAKFFLKELYGEKDFSQRDAQFSRVSDTLQRVFPKAVLNTAIDLATLHCLTEELDFEMGLAWTQIGASVSETLGSKYVRAWRIVGRNSDRIRQFRGALSVGHDLDKLTRLPGLRTMLKMMRRPARAAGLSELQVFLESGFDTFANIRRQGGSATAFMATIETREAAAIDALFNATLEGISGFLP